jgi:hypothetical protein
MVSQLSTARRWVRLDDSHSLTTVSTTTYEATMIGVRRSSSLSIAAGKTRSKALSVCRFFAMVTASEGMIEACFASVH